MQYIDVDYVDETIGLADKVNKAISSLYQLYDNKHTSEKMKTIIDDFVGDYLLKMKNEIEFIQNRYS